MNFTTDRLRLKLGMERLVGQLADSRTTQFNIGVSEAIDIADRNDQLTMNNAYAFGGNNASVIFRQCEAAG